MIEPSEGYGLWKKQVLVSTYREKESSLVLSVEFPWTACLGKSVLESSEAYSSIPNRDFQVERWGRCLRIRSKYR